MIDKVRTTVKSKTSKARNSDSKIGKFSNILNSPLMQGKNYNLIKGSKKFRIIHQSNNIKELY